MNLSSSTGAYPSSTFTETSTAMTVDHGIQSQSHNVRLCESRDRSFDTNEPLLNPKPIKYRHIQLNSTDQFRAELDQIKRMLSDLAGDDILGDIENIREQLESIIESNTGVVRHKDRKHILISIEKDGRLHNVKELFNQVVCKISELSRRKFVFE